MGIELKTVNPVVFDDPVYCQNIKKDKRCCYLVPFSQINEERCVLFPDLGKPRRLYFNRGTVNYKKCQQCKDHYKKAIESNKIEADHRTQHQKQMDKHFIE